MVGDFVGSTSAMEIDEEGATKRIAACLDVVKDAVTSHDGRIFNTAGDSSLAEFPSAVNALKAAMGSRSGLAAMPDSTPNDMRFGLHLADVIDVGNGLVGDGVNLATRIQSAAEPGQIEISEVLFDHVRRNSPCVFDDLGPRNFKGISEPVRIYRVRAMADRSRFQIVPTTQPTTTPIKPNSVVMTPLRTASSADEEQLFLAEGLTDDLTLELSRLRSVSVCSRSAASALTSNDPVEIGRMLGVRFVLSGSVRKLGSRFRLNISLTETEHGHIVWSERIQRPFDEVMDIMDDITARVAVTVSGRVEHAAVAAARLKKPENMSAYEFYLRGIDEHRMGGVTDAHVHAAVKWFEKAIAADPNYSRPLVMHCCSASFLPDFDVDKAEKMLSRALELDPTDPEAHRIMGVIRMKRDRDYISARFHHQKALDYAPNDAYVIGRCAAFFIFVGETDAALELLDQADILDPFLPVWVKEERVAALYLLGQYDHMLRTTNELPFQTRRTRIYRAAAWVALENQPKAAAEIRIALSEDPKLSIEYIRSQELYEDTDILQLLINRAQTAGLPEA